MVIAAFFDMDRTVVRCNTGQLYVKRMRKHGEIGLLKMLRMSSILLRYKFSLIDMNRVMSLAVEGLEGKTEAGLRDRCEALFESAILPMISNAAVEAIEGHRREGHRVVMLTAQTRYVTEPLSRHLDMDDYLCTQLAADDGVLTGQIVEPPCYGPGKCHWAQIYAEKHGIDLDASYFYTDSYSDLPMLRNVGHKRIVNPDPRLRLHATLHRWPVLSFQR